MKSSKPDNIEYSQYKSIRYLNLFRLLLSFFFFSIIFQNIGSIVGFSYTTDISRLIASIYLSLSILTWIASVLYKNHSATIGLIALAFDLPIIIALTLMFGSINEAWVILPVITIGSFAMLSRKPYAIIAMPTVATLLLWVIPKLLNDNDIHIDITSIFLYALIYFGIALVGIKQSQNYNQTLLLTQKQRSRISNLSNLNSLIINQMQSGVIAFDRDYKIILINNKAKEIVKVSRKQMLPTFLIKKIIATPGSAHKNFTIYGEEVLINLIHREKSSELSLLFIEEQKQINEKSQLINLATLGQLSATIAHELRNPMASIYSASQLLQESPDMNEEDKDIAAIISKQVERSNKIIEDILLMSKPHIAHQTSLNLFDKLKRFHSEFCQQNDLPESDFHIDCQDESLLIKFDSTHLTQILWNLAKNALKHGEGRKLSVVVSNQAKIVLIDFRNAGNTFEAIVEESIFTPFFTTHTQGTGLGLYICREMCKSNNAKLEYLRLEFQHVFRIHVLK